MATEPSLTLYDTTLRDGAQGEGVHFSLPDKLRLAERLASYGFHYVEGGWPGSNDKDRDFFAQAGKLHWGSSKLAAFGSTRRPNVDAADDSQIRLLLQAEEGGSVQRGEEGEGVEEGAKGEKGQDGEEEEKVRLLFLFSAAEGCSFFFVFLFFFSFYMGQPT